MKKLAIFGGPPAFKEPKHVGRPNMADSKKILHRFKEVLDSHWLTNNGRQVQQLEARICAALDIPWCVAVANGTLGLEIAAGALMPVLGEVIMPSFTFIATPNALAWRGYTPIFADIDPDTHVLDPKDVERKLATIAAKYRLALFFDAAHAFRCGPPWERIGHYGNCEVFSFHATKFFNSIEGGALVTSSTALAARFRRMRNFGFLGDGTHTTSELGINAKMSEFHAAVGLLNIEEMPRIITHNIQNYELYREGLDSPLIWWYPIRNDSNFQYVVMKVLGDDLSADMLVKVLQAENILARRYFSPPCHKMDPYNKRLWDLPVTEEVAYRTVVLPTGLAMSQEDVSKVCDVIRYCFAHIEEVNKADGKEKVSLPWKRD